MAVVSRGVAARARAVLEGEGISVGQGHGCGAREWRPWEGREEERL